MRKPIKWMLIGFGIFIGVIVVAVIIFFVSVAVSGIKEHSTPETKQVEQAKAPVTTKETETTTKVEYLALGQSIEYGGLRVSVTDCRFTDYYRNAYGRLFKPEEGAKYFWLYVKAKNIGEDILDLPFTTYFIAIYKDRDLASEPTDDIGLKDENAYHFDSVYPGHGVEGWMVYEIYKEAQPSDIKIHFEDFRHNTKVECYWKTPEQIQEVQMESKYKYLSLGQAFEYEGLRANVIKYEFAEWIKTDSEPLYPVKESIFFWIYVKAENTGASPKELPEPGDFYLLYNENEIGHDWLSADHSIDHPLYKGGWGPNVSDEGWILFGIPLEAKAEDIKVWLEDLRILSTTQCIWKIIK